MYCEKVWAVFPLAKVVFPPAIISPRHGPIVVCTLVNHLKSQEPDEFEINVANELAQLELSSSELKASLRDLYITAAKEVDCGSGRKAIVIYVPYKQQKSYQKIQARLVRELEKKFSGRHVMIIAQRNILGKSYARSQKTKGLRPRSRTVSLLCFTRL